MWPMLSGTNSTSPRDELVLSMNADASTYGLILGHYKLVVCAKCEGFFPGVHIPNSTNDGRNITNSCDPGCLFDLAAGVHIASAITIINSHLFLLCLAVI
jgi:hypothetical protein